MLNLNKNLGVMHKGVNISKTKEIVVDFRSNKSPTPPLQINNEDVEQVHSLNFLGSTIPSDLSWSAHTLDTHEKSSSTSIFS